MSEKPPSDDCERAAHSATAGRRRSFELALFISGGGKGSHLLFLLTSLLIGPTPGSQCGRIWEWKSLWAEDPRGGKRQKSDGWGRLLFLLYTPADAGCRRMCISMTACPSPFCSYSVWLLCATHALCNDSCCLTDASQRGQMRPSDTLMDSNNSVYLNTSASICFSISPSQECLILLGM